MNFKDLDFISDFNIGALPDSFFFFEGILWILLIGIPFMIWAFSKGKFKVVSPKFHQILQCFVLGFGTLGLIAFSNIWIFFLSIIGSLLIYHWEKRVQSFKKPLIFLGIFCWICLVWGSFFESHRLVVNESWLDIPDLPHMKIAVIADIHVGPYKKATWVAKVLKRIESIKDIEAVFIPGDWVYGDSEFYGKELAPFKNFSIPTFATLGNHDHFKNPIQNAHQASFVNQFLNEYGVHPLNNESVFWKEKGIIVAGVDDNDLGYDDLGKTYKGIDFQTSSILLAHSPDIILKLKDFPLQSPALILSGHTHCGQIRLPFYGALPLIIPTTLGKKLEKHYYFEQGRHIFITCGVGEVGPRGRFFNPPEISVLNIN